MGISRLAAPDRVMGVRTANDAVIGDVTLAGSFFFVLFVGIAVGVATALAFVVVDPWILWTRLFRGVALGVVLFAFFGFAVLEKDNIDFIILRNPGLNVAMFAVLYLLVGVGAVSLQNLLLARLPEASARGEDHRSEALPSYLLLGVGVLLIGVVVFTLGTSADSAQGRVAAAFLFALSVATAGTWAITYWGALTRLEAWIRGGGFVAFIGLLITTGSDTLARITGIIG